MIAYHGTTNRRAERICQEGFRPRKPSKRVWFAVGRGYAERRARQHPKRLGERHEQCKEEQPEDRRNQ